MTNSSQVLGVCAAGTARPPRQSDTGEVADGVFDARAVVRELLRAVVHELLLHLAEPDVSGGAGCALERLGWRILGRRGADCGCSRCCCLLLLHGVQVLHLCLKLTRARSRAKTRRARWNRAASPAATSADPWRVTVGWRRCEDDGVTTKESELTLETTVREPDGGLLASGDGSANGGHACMELGARAHTTGEREGNRRVIRYMH